MSGEVTYSFGERLAGGGIGQIAGHAVAGAHRAGLLEKVVTMEAARPDVPSRLVDTVPLGSLLNRCPFPWIKDPTYDRLATRQFEPTALFHGWNNMCLRSLRKANRAGSVTVVERASTHPSVQRRLVEREYREHGVDRSLTNERLHQRALTELRETDYVFVPSEFVYDSFRKEGFEQDRLVQIPFGVDTERFEPPGDMTRREEPFRAVFVGQVSLRKGIQYLLPAWREANIDGELLIAGQVTEDAENVVSEFREDPSIRFLGWVDGTAELYREASGFVFPSIEEGSALVSYEAMASGLPAVVTPNVGSLVEDGEHGVIVPPRNVGAIADALERLAANPDERERFGRNARNKVKDYTWEAYGDRIAAAYRDLLANTERSVTK